MDILPGRAFCRAHDQIRPGLPPREVARVLTDLVHVWMGTFNLSGQSVILLNADGTVREVSKVDGYIK